MSGEMHDPAPSTDPAFKIPVIREELVITTDLIETGSVIVKKSIVEEQAVVDRTLARDEVIVERKEVNRYVDVAPPAVRQEGNVTIMSVVKEVLVVEKRLMLVEELHITRQQHQEQQTFSETLRKEEISIHRTGAGTDIDQAHRSTNH